MATYVFLTRWTDQGALDPATAVERARVAVDRMEQIGVKIFETYWTMGPYDLVMVADCEDVETAHAASLDMASRGNIRSTVLPAFDAGEMAAIVERLPS